MTNSVMENIVSIEMGPLFVDEAQRSNYLMIQTRRNRYCFKLSDKTSVEQQFDMFNAFAKDLNTPLENVEERKAEQPDENKTQWTMDSAQEEPKEEKHDGAKLFDETIPAPTDVEITVKE